jgi:hypothetical protein
MLYCGRGNQITFDKKVVRSPMVTVFATCAFLRYWAGLYNEEDKGKIVAGADQMMRKASELASQVAGGQETVRRLLLEGCLSPMANLGNAGGVSCPWRAAVCLWLV